MIPGLVTKICHFFQKKNWEEEWRYIFHSCNFSHILIMERCRVCGMRRVRFDNKEKSDGRKDC